MKHTVYTVAVLASLSSILVPARAFGFFLDGNGHYGLLGETRLNPEFQEDRGTYQATRISLDLHGEVKANDRASFNLRLGLSDDPSSLYLGDTPRPKTCESNDGSTTSSCDGKTQSTTDTGYSNYRPVIREAYGKYAFNYCLLSAGRRSREIGVGALMSAGNNPFDNDASIYDGVTCDVNLQKHQDLGFMFGIDKLQETGDWIERLNLVPGAPAPDGSRKFGANSNADDMEQFFLAIQFDDLKTKSPGSFAKQVTIYFSNILSSNTNTDVKFFDLYSGFYYGKFALKNELIFRLGKTADPGTIFIGGKRPVDGATNSINSMGLAGTLEYTISKSGAALGPAEFNEGNFKRHLIFSEYAYAPGDSDGYFVDKTTENGRAVSGTDNTEYGEVQRDARAKALPFHRNYHPAMLFFNGRSPSKAYTLSGVFDPTRVMNVALYTLGYRYESMENGDFEFKVITGRMLEAPPEKVKEYYGRNPYQTSDRPFGFYGSDLGYELDLKYAYHYQKEVDLGVGLAAALPGQAWRVSSENKPKPGFGLSGSVAIKF